MVVPPTGSGGTEAITERPLDGRPGSRIEWAQPAAAKLRRFSLLALVLAGVCAIVARLDLDPKGAPSTGYALAGLLLAASVYLHLSGAKESLELDDGGVTRVRQFGWWRRAEAIRRQGIAGAAVEALGGTNLGEHAVVIRGDGRSLEVGRHAGAGTREAIARRLTEYLAGGA
jgi:hypothetical protein